MMRFVNGDRRAEFGERVVDLDVTTSIGGM